MSLVNGQENNRAQDWLNQAKDDLLWAKDSHTSGHYAQACLVEYPSQYKPGTIQFCKKLNGNSRASEILAEPSRAAENKNSPQHESKCDQHFDNAVTKLISGEFITDGQGDEAIKYAELILAKSEEEFTDG